jgi:hypothetical protein
MFVQGHIVLGAPDATVMAPRLTDVAILKIIASRMNTDAGICAAKLLKHNGVNAAIQRFYCIAADNRFVRRFLARVFAILHPCAHRFVIWKRCVFWLMCCRIAAAEMPSRRDTARF